MGLTTLNTAFFVAAVLLVAGCISPDSPAEPLGARSGSTVVVEGEGGEQFEVPVTNETGAVVGEVLTDAGFGLPGAHVTVFGAPQAATTNNTGWFQVLDVEPGRRPVRVEHPSYNPAESEVDVRAGRVTRLAVTLVPAVEAGYRPHVHDDWGERAEVVVIDSKFEFNRHPFSGPAGTISEASLKAQQTAQPPCISASAQSRSAYTSPFYFDDPEQLVWSGTNRIEMVVSWNQLDFVGGNKVGVVYRSPETTSYTWSDGLAAGGKLTIMVSPEMADSAHQVFSLWEFALCVQGKDEPLTAGNIVGRSFVGSYHVTMTIYRGFDPPVDPPHPRFWQNGSTIRVLDGQRKISCTSPQTTCTIVPVYGRPLIIGGFRFVPTDLIPPGSEKLHIWLNWTYSTPIANVAIGLAMSPADIRPHEKDLPSKYEAVAASTRTPNAAFFEVNLRGSAVDGYYQAKTNWAFLWGPEGKETSDEYVHTCACELVVDIVVHALRAPEVG